MVAHGGPKHEILTLQGLCHRTLFLAMADTCAHTALLATNFPSTFARLLHSHEILSNIRPGLFEIAAFSAFAVVCESVGYHRTPTLINTCSGAMVLERQKTCHFLLIIGAFARLNEELDPD